MSHGLPVNVIASETAAAERPRSLVWARVGARVVELLPLVAILLLAVELRLIFYTGLVGEDSLTYAHVAENLASGHWQLAPGVVHQVGVRAALYGPVALLYAWFGPSEAATVAWPFACSLVGIVCAYGLARLLAGESAGLLAAFLWAILPTNVVAATALLGDGPIAAMSIAVVFFLLLAQSARGWKRIGAAGAAALCLLIGILNKLLMLLTVLFLFVHAVTRSRRSRLASLVAPLLLLVMLAAYLYYFRNLGGDAVTRDFPTLAAVVASTATDWWSKVVVGSGELSWISPLWIVAASVLLGLRRREAYVPLLWFSSMFLFLELGSSELTRYMPIPVQAFGTVRHFLLVAAPATIATGIYLGGGTGRSLARRVTLGAVLTVGVIAWVGTRHATNLTWGATGEADAALPFATASAIATAFVIFGGLASPLFLVGGADKIRSAALAMLFIAIGTASLNPSYRAANDYRAPWLATSPQAIRFLEGQPRLPIFVQNATFGQRLDYLSGFRLGFDSELRTVGRAARIRIAPPDATSIRGDAHVLVDEWYLKPAQQAAWGAAPLYFAIVPDKWIEVARFGAYDGARLRIYRTVNAPALARLRAARLADQSAATAATLSELVHAATAAGEHCEAAAAVWQASREDPARVRLVDPMPLVATCCADRPDACGRNLLANGDFATNLQSWRVPPEAQATVGVETVPGTDPVFHVRYWKGGDGRALAQQAVLRPDTLYVYQANVRSTVPIVALQWQADIGRTLEKAHTYSRWTPLRHAFLTPHWDGRPRLVTFTPIMINTAGEAWVKGVRVSEFPATR